MLIQSKQKVLAEPFAQLEEHRQNCVVDVDDRQEHFHWDIRSRKRKGPYLPLQCLFELQLIVKCKQPLLNFAPLISEPAFLLENLLLELLEHLKVFYVPLLALALLLVLFFTFLLHAGRLGYHATGRLLCVLLGSFWFAGFGLNAVVELSVRGVQLDLLCLGELRLHSTM